MTRRCLAWILSVALLLMVLPLGLTASAAPSLTQHTYNFYQIEGYYKAQGRTTLNGTSLEMDTSAAGFEFYFYGKGNVTVKADIACNYTTDMYMVAIVDNVRTRIHVENTGNHTFTSHDLAVATNLSEGYHHIELYKQTEASSALVTARELTLTGTLQAGPPADKLVLELVGDSISGGTSSLWTGTGTAGTEAYPLYQDGTQSYGYLTAEALGANFRVTQTSGYGCVNGWNSDGKNLQDMFPYTSYWRSKTVLYDFVPKADVVVINLGTNDIGVGVTNTQFKQGATNLMNMAREKNPGCKIVWCTGMMGVFYTSAVKGALSDLGGEDSGYYYCELPKGTSGGAGHPNVAQHKAAAQVLTQFLLDNCLPSGYQSDFADTAALNAKLTQAKAIASPSNALQTAIQLGEMDIACGTTDAYRLGCRVQALDEAMNGTVTAADLLPVEHLTTYPTENDSWIWPYYGNGDGSVTLYKCGQGWYWPHTATTLSQTWNVVDTPYLNMKLYGTAAFNVILTYRAADGAEYTVSAAEVANNGNDYTLTDNYSEICANLGGYVKALGHADEMGNVGLISCRLFTVGEDQQYARIFECRLTDDGAYGAPDAITTDETHQLTDGVLTGVAAGTTAGELTAALPNGTYLSVLENGMPVTGTLKTGMTLRLTVNGTTVQEAAIAVTGDVTCDGLANAQDCRTILMSTMSQTSWSAVQKRAGDVDGDGSVSTSDVRTLLKRIVTNG